MTRNQQDNIVITGATDGIGKAAAIHLARRGARLLLFGRSSERCMAVVDEIVTLKAWRQTSPASKKFGRWQIRFGRPLTTWMC